MQPRVSELVEVYTRVNGRLMHAWTSTAGPVTVPPIVLVHGLGVSGRYLLPTAVLLAPHYPVYVPDLPGFGQSDKPSHVLNIPELTDALAGWMRRLGLAGACLVGNSLGCQFIVDLAPRYPELIERAVLVGPTLDPQARTLGRQIGRGLLDLLGEPFSYWPLLTWDYLKAGPLRTLRTLQYALQDPVAAKLSQVRIPGCSSGFW